MLCKNVLIFTICNGKRSIRKNRNKDIYIRTLLILLKALDVSPLEFFSDPIFNSEELDIDFK